MQMGIRHPMFEAFVIMLLLSSMVLWMQKARLAARQMRPVTKGLTGKAKDSESRNFDALSQLERLLLSTEA